jgi:hypothetical protein
VTLCKEAPHCYFYSVFVNCALGFKEDEGLCLNCHALPSPFVEESLCLTAIIMMFFTVLYISTDWNDGGMRRNNAVAGTADIDGNIC